MKSLKLIGLHCFLLCMALCLPAQAKEKVVEFPLIQSCNNGAIDISRVELTKSATRLRIYANYRPHYWIRLDSKSYLQAGGKKYMLTSAEGITPDSLFWMPDSGEASFTLCFEPLPMDTETFDFIESDCEDCWKLLGVDLTGQRLDTPPAGLPSDVQDIDWNAHVPAPIFEVGTTTVKVHLLNYRPEQGTQLEAFVNDLYGGQHSYFATVNTETAEATFSFLQYGPVDFFISNNKSDFTLASAKLAPGETAELYIDMRTEAYRHQDIRWERHQIAESPTFRRAYALGKYANLNNALNVLADRPYFGMDLLTGEFCDYKMTSSQYAAHVLNTYRTHSDSLAQSNLAPIMKEYAQLVLQQEALIAMDEGDFLREHNYRHTHDQWDHSKKIEGIDSLTVADASTVLQIINPNDSMLLMGDDILQYATALAGSRNFDWAQMMGVDSGLAYDLRHTGMYTVMAENLQITDDDFARLRQMRSPFYYEAFSQVQAKAQAEVDAVEALAKIEPTPDVPLDELFDAIIAPHKGKVVFVDFWATWCGPCRESIHSIEPLKSTELKSDDLVWIYITDESSPLTKYKTMIPNIQGLHYRLTKEQWRKVFHKFDTYTIPSYVLVDKAGNYSLRNDLRNDHTVLKTTLLEELSKETE